MLQVRRGVFETNSSSSHSIVMMKASKPFALAKDDWRLSYIERNGGELYFYGDRLCFGRTPFDILSDWAGRLRCAIASSTTDEEISHLEEICRRRIPHFVRFKFDKSEREDGSPDRGYVDHQSCGTLKAALKEFGISVEEFIFNDRYIVVVDGDEFNVFDAFMNSGMFNEDAVEEIIPSVDEYMEQEDVNI